MTDNIVFIDLSHVYDKPACAFLDTSDGAFWHSEDRQSSVCVFYQTPINDRLKVLVPKGFFDSPHVASRKNLYKDLRRSILHPDPDLGDLSRSLLLIEKLYKDEFDEGIE